jgi:hypothetical protein
VPHTSWTVGRNNLYAEARTVQQKQGWRAEYLVFTDDDVELFTAPANGNPYDLFHAALGNVQPAVGAVGFVDPKDVSKVQRNANCGAITPCAPDIDAAVNAFHATAAPMLLPYVTVWDDVDWWSSQGALIELMVASMPEHVVQFNQIFMMNSVHRPYPRGGHASPCLKPKNGGFSPVALYLMPRVSECLRDQIGLYRVGSWIKCQACEKTCACASSADCKPGQASSPGGPGWAGLQASCPANLNASEPINYADVVKCKPNLKMDSEILPPLQGTAAMPLQGTAAMQLQGIAAIFGR